MYINMNDGEKNKSQPIHPRELSSVCLGYIHFMFLIWFGGKDNV